MIDRAVEFVPTPGSRIGSPLMRVRRPGAITVSRAAMELLPPDTRLVRLMWLPDVRALEFIPDSQGLVVLTRIGRGRRAGVIRSASLTRWIASQHIPFGVYRVARQPHGALRATLVREDPP